MYMKFVSVCDLWEQTEVLQPGIIASTDQGDVNTTVEKHIKFLVA